MGSDKAMVACVKEVEFRENEYERGFTIGNYRLVAEMMLSRKHASLHSGCVRRLENGQIVHVIEIYENEGRIWGKLHEKEWVMLKIKMTGKVLFQFMDNMELSATGTLYEATRKLFVRKSF